jgi:hypothetical protein
MVTEAGSYTASIQNVCGISAASNSIEIAALALPEAAVIAADGATTICEGDAVTLAASNVCSNCTLVWSDGSNNPEIVTGTAGMYTATVQNTCGSSPASNSIEIVVNTIPAAPVVTPASSALCPGTSVMLTVENVCPGCTVVWSNGVVGNELSVTTAGDFSATLKNDCGESSASSIASVSVLPEFSPVIAVTNTCQLAAPQGSNYQWLLNGTPIVGANSQFWTAQVTGIYSLQMTNSDGCNGAATPTLVQACVSGVQQLGNGFTARLFPNPTDEHLFMTIQSPVSMAVKLDLFAADGRFVGTLFQGDIQQGQQTLETRLPAVASGMYHYRLSTEMGDVTGTVLVDR